MRLLLVEDEDTVRRHLCRALDRADHEVLLAASGDEARALASDTAALDGLITDLGLPDGSGWDLAQQLREQFPELNVLITTGSAPPPIDDEPRVGVLLKPFRLQQLLEAVEDWSTSTPEQLPAPLESGVLDNRQRRPSEPPLMLLGPAAEGPRLSLGAPYPPLPSADREQTGLTARAGLGPDEAVYRRLLQKLHVGVLVYDAEGRLAAVNPKARALLGLQGADQYADARTWQTVGEDGAPLPANRRPERLALRTGNPVREIVMGMVRPSGDRTWVLASAEPERDAEGRVGHVVVTLSDITEMRRLQDELRHSSVMESLGGVAGGVAHDFNNLLTVIEVSAEWLRELLPEHSEAHQEASRILETAHRASGLTHKLLTFARQRPNQQPAVLSLDDRVEGLLSLTRRTLDEDIEVRVDLDASPWRVEIDPTGLEQVLVNLMVNARDAMPRGGTLTVSSRRVPASTHQERCGDMVELRVRDTGVGIPESVLPRIFEPFYTTKERGRGTGMGLATVYGIVREAGGQVQVESAPAGGTTFTVRLPRSLSDSVERDTSVRARSPSMGSATVLLVEDEPAVRFQARRLLELASLRVIEAANGVEALALLEQRGDEIDLLITDVVLPGCSGTDLARALRLRSRTPGVLYVSGYPEWRLRGIDFSQPHTGFLHKPYNRETLLAKVGQLLGENAASGELKLA